MELQIFNFGTKIHTDSLHGSFSKFTLVFLCGAQQSKSGLDRLVLRFQYHTQIGIYSRTPLDK
jgi:hypothetical protein